MDETKEIVLAAILREMRACVDANTDHDGVVPDTLVSIDRLICAACQVMSGLPVENRD